jgi:hypothetical protein
MQTRTIPQPEHSRHGLHLNCPDNWDQGRRRIQTQSATKIVQGRAGEVEPKVTSHSAAHQPTHPQHRKPSTVPTFTTPTSISLVTSDA